MAEKMDGYVFQRNANATSRLNYQYYLWQTAYGFHLHPEIPKLKPGARVADVATGSGIWLCDLVRQVSPDVSFHGFDISLKQVPPQLKALSNVKFSEWNFFEPPPLDLQGTFDVVHMRLIAVVVKDSKPERIIANVAKLLKPGGYLQWEEHYTAKATVLEGADGTPSTAHRPGLERLRKLMSDDLHSSSGQQLLGSRDWLETVPSMMEGIGFSSTQRIMYDEVPLLGVFMTQMYLDSAEEFAAHMLQVDPPLGKEIKEMVENVHKEIHEGGWLLNPKCVFLGMLRSS